MRFRCAKLACDGFTEDADFGKKKYLFRWSSFWSCRVCKQAKLSHLGHAYIEKNSKRVTEWCGFWFRGIIGPFFFENKQGVAVAVIIGPCWTNFCLQKLKRRILALYCWFQQNGATCYTVEAILDILRFVFEDCSISIAENRTYILKPEAPKTRHCLVQILVQRHIWAIFLRKWARSVRHSQWRSLSRRILATFGFNSAMLRATQPKLYSMFCALFLKIALWAACSHRGPLTYK